ncbi:AAA family ATPase, partial [Methanosarcina mazei]
MRFNISSIDLTNFRQYRGTQTINFDIDNSKNVSIILGKNGAGKSNILNALTWCFYGVEVHKDKETSVREGMPIINTSAVASLDYNQSTYAEVVVHIITNMGPWTIKRRIEGNKKNDGNLYLKPSELTVIYPVGNQDKVETGEDTQILVNNLLPEALKGFFFIDGEQLREFFKFSTPRKIADAIDKVSQLELLYKSEEHLKLMESTLRKGVKSTTPELEKVQREIQDIENWIEQTKKIIEQKEFEND